MATMFYQVATAEKFAEYGLDVTKPGTLPSGQPYTPTQIKQENRIYLKTDGFKRDIDIKKDMYIRHLEYANCNLEQMMIDCVELNDKEMLPISYECLMVILANEPSEEV